MLSAFADFYHFRHFTRFAHDYFLLMPFNAVSAKGKGKDNVDLYSA